MTTVAPAQKVVVLRSPQEEGNFRYWMAEFSREDAHNWEERLKATERGVESEIGGAFGDPLTLPQVMKKLEHRPDFQVLDFPRH
ncbi:MAG TPA: hypothetical protein VG326_11305 [Tepidisphaeraceae bacterium]|nr:hypothetical protein [Tepidisphaeraceae bacterium]